LRTFQLISQHITVEEKKRPRSGAAAPSPPPDPHPGLRPSSPRVVDLRNRCPFRYLHIVLASKSYLASLEHIETNDRTVGKILRTPRSSATEWTKSARRLRLTGCVHIKATPENDKTHERNSIEEEVLSSILPDNRPGHPIAFPAHIHRHRPRNPLSPVQNGPVYADESVPRSSASRCCPDSMVKKRPITEEALEFSAIIGRPTGRYLANLFRTSRKATPSVVLGFAASDSAP